MSPIEVANLRTKIGVLAGRVPVFNTVKSAGDRLLLPLVQETAADSGSIESICAGIASECAAMPIPNLVAEIDNSLLAHTMACANPLQLEAYSALYELHRAFKKASENETLRLP